MNEHEAWSEIVSSPGDTDQTSPASVPYLSPPDSPATAADTDGAVEPLAARPVTTVAAPQQQRSTASDVSVPPAADDLQARLTIIAQHAVRQGADCCIVWLRSADEQYLQPLAFAHRDPRQYASLHRRLQPLPVHDDGRPLMEALDTVHAGPGTKPARNMLLPLHKQGEDLGIFEISVAVGTWPSTARLPEAMQQLVDEATLIIENARLRQKLDKAERELREYPGRVLIAREEERKRVAHDIHDGFAQFATAAHQHLQAIVHADRLRDPESRRQLGQVMELVQQAILEARAIIAGVPPPTLYQHGLAAAIRHQVVALTADGRECSFEDEIGLFAAA